MKLLKSKKFLVSVAGVVAVIGNHFFGIPEQDMLQVTSIVISYVLGQGLADLGKEAK